MLLNNKVKINKERQNALILSVEGIGDILVYEAGRYKNKLVINGLETLFNLVDDLVVLKNNDLSKFESIVLSEDFSELRSKDKDRAELKHSIQLGINKDYIGFFSPVNQIFRTFYASLEIGNSEATDECMKLLSKIMARLVMSSDNESLLQNILYQYLEAIFESNKKYSEHYLKYAISWYVNIIFSTLNGEFNSFKPYLQIFNKTLFSYLRRIVRLDKKNIFEKVVSGLFQCYPGYVQDRVIYKYSSNYDLSPANNEKANSDRCPNSILRETNQLQTKLYTFDQLEAWLNGFNKAKNFLQENFKCIDPEGAKEDESEILRSSVKLYCHNELKKVIFCMSGYCLFKEQIDYIKDIWEYAKPGDAENHLVTHDITPRSIDDAVCLFVNKGLYGRAGYDYFEGHHSYEKYNREYFILLIANILNRSEGSNAFQQLPYELKIWDISALYDLNHSISRCLELTDELLGKKMVRELFMLEPEALRELFGRVKVILNNMNKQIESQKRVLEKI